MGNCKLEIVAVENLEFFIRHSVLLVKKLRFALIFLLHFESNLYMHFAFTSLFYFASALFHFVLRLYSYHILQVTLHSNEPRPPRKMILQK